MHVSGVVESSLSVPVDDDLRDRSGIKVTECKDRLL